MNFIKKTINKSPISFLVAIYLRDRICKHIRYGSQDINNELYESLVRDGCYAVSDDLAFDDIEELRFIADKYINNSLNTAGDKRIFNADRFIENPKLKDNILSSAHDLIVDSYLGEKSILETVLLAKMDYKIDNKGSGQGWHRDSYSKQIKTISYLSDVSIDNGPFEYLLGSHTYKSILQEVKFKLSICNDVCSQQRFSDRFVDRIIELYNFKSKKFCAKAGTTLVADVRGIHRGAPMNSGTRYAVTRYLIAESQYNKSKY